MGRRRVKIPSIGGSIYHSYEVIYAMGRGVQNAMDKRVRYTMGREFNISSIGSWIYHE